VTAPIPTSEAEQSRAALAAIVTLSESMLRTAREQDWFAVVEHEARRRELLAAVCGAAHAFDRDAYRATLIRLLELDREIVALGEIAQRETGAQLQLVHQGRRAQLAYHDTGA
jgi:hypothetical protein